MSDKPECVIIAPHFDDEIIGCYEVIMNPLIKPIIVYLQDDEERKKESLSLKKFIDRIQVQLFQKSIPSVVIDPKNVLYFPDPYFETFLKKYIQVRRIFGNMKISISYLKVVVDGCYKNI